MFRDVPACSGMFRNVPCSGFYRRPFPYLSEIVGKNLGLYVIRGMYYTLTTVYSF